MAPRDPSSSASRRAFLRSTLGTGAALIVGCESGDGGSGGIGPADAATTGDAATDDAGNGNAATDDASSLDGGRGRAGANDAFHDAGGQTDQADDSGPTEDAAAEVDAPTGPTCADPFEAGEYLGDVDFESEGTAPLDTPLNSGLNGRLYTDLSNLTPENFITPVEDFYIRTRVPDQIDFSGDWTVRITGMVAEEITLTAADWEPLIQEIGPVLLECSGNGDFAHFGMLSTANWHGIPVADIFDMADIDAASTRVVIGGFDGHSPPHPVNSSPGAAWVFTLEQLYSYGAFFGTHMNGEPLTPDHGFPIRLVVPRWYGCCNCKWLEEIRFTDDSEPATTQMMEFAYRTHQPSVPALAIDYLPATMDQAAMPVRMEKWLVDGAITYKVVGVMWGGYETTDKLQIQIGGPSSAWEPVDVCPTQTTNDHWTVWSHQFTPTTGTTYRIKLRVDDPAVVTRRLDSGFYDRSVVITDVG